MRLRWLINTGNKATDVHVHGRRQGVCEVCSVQCAVCDILYPVAPPVPPAPQVLLMPTAGRARDSSSSTNWEFGTATRRASLPGNASGAAFLSKTCKSVHHHRPCQWPITPYLTDQNAPLPQPIWTLRIDLRVPVHSKDNRTSVRLECQLAW